MFVKIGKQIEQNTFLVEHDHKRKTFFSDFFSIVEVNFPDKRHTVLVGPLEILIYSYHDLVNIDIW